jgi:hypothetical protein
LHRILDPVVAEFINSSPFPFRQLAQFGKEKGAKDLVLVPKSAAIAQVMSLLLFCSCKTSLLELLLFGRWVS